MPIQHFQRLIRKSERYAINMFDSMSFCGLVSKHLYSKTISTELSNKCFSRKMDHQKIINLDYETAITTLNGLQSNAATIQKSILMGTQHDKFEQFVKFLNRSGMSLDHLDELSVIHVSGTKGKGTTCALTESILNANGVRTGFYSSPHLISVTERFRINGQPISQDEFTKNFWEIYNILNKNKEHEKDMPAYFSFLTILCFHIFLKKKVDVAIIEVGIGGRYDSTNIIRNTKIVGITSLGLEHTKLLGDSLDKIAYQKAGIIKDNCTVFTNVDQTECLRIIEENAKDKNANLVIVPAVNEYNWPSHFEVDKLNKNQSLNISLAIQLALGWLKLQQPSSFNELIKVSPVSNIETFLEISEKIIIGINKCYWPGRCQMINLHNFDIYLDGAHTEESLTICSEWFNKLTNKSGNVKVLLFNVTGDRDVQTLLKILLNYNNFNLLSFVPNIPFNKNNCIDVLTTQNQTVQMISVESHAECCRSLFSKNQQNEQVQVFKTVLDSFEYLRHQYGTDRKLDVLVTGSLHLIGATILALEELDIQINTK